MAADVVSFRARARPTAEAGRPSPYDPLDFALSEAERLLAEAADRLVAGGAPMPRADALCYLSSAALTLYAKATTRAQAYTLAQHFVGPLGGDAA